MDRRLLQEKLGNISHDELGFSFDEGKVWEQLETKLQNPVRPTRNRRLLVAASLFLAVCFFPIKTLIFVQGEVGGQMASTPVGSTQAIQIPEQQALTNVSERQEQLPILKVKKKEIDLQLVTAEPLPIHMEPLKLQQVKKEIKPLFAVEDISVIQASLDQTGSDERRADVRKMAIRAQWQSSFKSPANVEYQALKIKLNDDQK